jgi:hypothetical protein
VHAKTKRIFFAHPRAILVLRLVILSGHMEKQRMDFDPPLWRSTTELMLLKYDLASSPEFVDMQDRSSNISLCAQRVCATPLVEYRFPAPLPYQVELDTRTPWRRRRYFRTDVARHVVGPRAVDVPTWNRNLSLEARFSLLS